MSKWEYNDTWNTLIDANSCCHVIGRRPFRAAAPPSLGPPMKRTCIHGHHLRISHCILCGWHSLYRFKSLLAVMTDWWEGFFTVGRSLSSVGPSVIFNLNFGVVMVSDISFTLLFFFSPFCMTDFVVRCHQNIRWHFTYSNEQLNSQFVVECNQSNLLCRKQQDAVTNHAIQQLPKKSSSHCCRREVFERWC